MSKRDKADIEESNTDDNEGDEEEEESEEESEEEEEVIQKKILPQRANRGARMKTLLSNMTDGGATSTSAAARGGGEDIFWKHLFEEDEEDNSSYTMSRSSADEDDSTDSAFDDDDDDDDAQKNDDSSGEESEKGNKRRRRADRNGVVADGQFTNRKDKLKALLAQRKQRLKRREQATQKKERSVQVAPEQHEDEDTELEEDVPRRSTRFYTIAASAAYHKQQQQKDDETAARNDKKQQRKKAPAKEKVKWSQAEYMKNALDVVRQRNLDELKATMESMLNDDDAVLNAVGGRRKSSNFKKKKTLLTDSTSTSKQADTQPNYYCMVSSRQKWAPVYNTPTLIMFRRHELPLDPTSESTPYMAREQRVSPQVPPQKHCRYVDPVSGIGYSTCEEYNRIRRGVGQVATFWAQDGYPAGWDEKGFPKDSVMLSGSMSSPTVAKVRHQVLGALVPLAMGADEIENSTAKSVPPSSSPPKKKRN